ncbi:SNF2 family N-terminal domain-containing protein [Scleroderma citrinum]
MVQTRRKSARVAATPATTTTVTPSTTASPILSNQHSIEPETPDTSDIEEVEQKVATKTSAVARNTRKRAADAEPEVATKRRAMSSSVFVEIPARNSAFTAKGKGKAVEPPLSEEDDGDGYNSCDEPGYVDESEPSGSEFELSDDDMPLSRGIEWDVVQGSDEDEEALMVSAAIELSRQTARQETQRRSGAGSSSKTTAKKPTRKTGATRRRAAMRTKAKKKENDKEPDDVSFDSEVIDDSELSGLSDNDDPVISSIKKAKETGDMLPFSRLKREEQREIKKQEMAMARKLGRRLTTAEKNSIRLLRHHPELRNIWGDLESRQAIATPEKADQPAGLKVTLLPFQRESLSWMRKQEGGIWKGGILADEMGMGKTIQMISLFVSDLKRPNLVIAPTVAIMQWRNEINAHTEDISVLVWHGASRVGNPKELEKYDVVLTTYAVLESCFRKQQAGFKRKGVIVIEKSPLHLIKWNRVILDEAHNIKERATNTAKACFELQSNYKWCLSGTPLQNRVGELYSLIRFLGGDPYSYYFCKLCNCKSLHWKFTDRKSCDECGHNPMQHTCFWNNEILTPIQKHGMVGTGQIAFKKLRVLLDQVMLRRTKLQRADDLGLPPRTVIVRRDYFSPEESELYLSLFTDAKREFSTYVDAGTLLNNYSNIFSLITRMRQMACHPDLVLRSKKNTNQFFDSAEEGTVCRLCNDFAEDAIQAKCRHIFDRECIKQYLSAACDVTPKCPICHLPLTIDLEAPPLELDTNGPAARQGILGRLNLDTWRSSSKIEALVEELTNLRLQDRTTKSIVFSQFVNFLDLIAYRLQKAGFQICRLEGTMSPQARDATIQHFMNSVEVTVFLVSLKAGGVALNLTEASRVYLMDSWWNPASSPNVPTEAMDRIHRLGQHRPVQAIKLVIEDSIESRIVQLQEKKSAMVDATLSTDDSAMGRLTPEDVCSSYSYIASLTD